MSADTATLEVIPVNDHSQSVTVSKEVVDRSPKLQKLQSKTLDGKCFLPVDSKSLHKIIEFISVDREPFEYWKLPLPLEHTVDVKTLLPGSIADYLNKIEKEQPDFLFLVQLLRDSELLEIQSLTKLFSILIARRLDSVDGQELMDMFQEKCTFDDNERQKVAEEENDYFAQAWIDLMREEENLKRADTMYDKYIPK